MASSKLFSLLLPILILLLSPPSSSTSLFREYIGAMSTGVKFSDVPIHSGIVDFHFILSFGIDYTTTFDPPAPTNGFFNAFWDTYNLSSSAVSAIKHAHPNVKVALSLGGDTVLGRSNAYFDPTTIDSWVNNSIISLTSIIRRYNLDGIDIDYEHFRAGPRVFAECVGRLVAALKRDGVVSFVSIAPYADPKVQKHYMALWRRYGELIDYVNFQFYAYDNSTTVQQFLSYFEEQSCNYKGGKVLVSFTTDLGGGLLPENGFFRACRRLKMEGKLHGIFAWSADTSIKDGFRYEKRSQSLLLLG